MALIVEDGTGVAGANSLSTRAEIIAYAATRGVVIADVDASDVFAIKATDYFFYLENRFMGARTYDTQELPFPRTGLIVGMVAYPDDEIPAKVKRAHLQLALEAANGVELVPSQAGGNRQFLTKQKLGPIEREFSEAVALSSGILPTLPLVDELLYPFMFGGVTRAYRV